MTQRLCQILELLTDTNRMEVSLLAEKLGVSQVTVRKDLDGLERWGIVVREHGFAVLRSTDDINGRIAWHYETKKQIAVKAAEWIHDGDTIMIESGSCCALLADTLTEARKDLTIITNSAFIADYIRRKSGFQVILLGGIYQQDSQVLVGPMVRQCVENFCVDLLLSEQTAIHCAADLPIRTRCGRRQSGIWRRRRNRWWCLQKVGNSRNTASYHLILQTRSAW